MKLSGHSDIPLEQLLPRVGSLYKLVIAASQRAQEVAEGAPSLVADPSDKPTITSLTEILRGKVTVRVKDATT